MSPFSMCHNFKHVHFFVKMCDIFKCLKHVQHIIASKGNLAHLINLDMDY